MKKEPMPQFCKKCANVRTTILTGEPYCKLACKYNPRFGYMASATHYRRMSGAGVL